MKTLRVTGTGSAAAPVDRVVLRFEVFSQEMDYGESVDVLNGLVARLRQDIDASGTSSKDLRSTSYSVDAETHWDSEAQESVFLGYRARHHLTLDIPWDQDRLNDLLCRVSEGGSCADLDIHFTVDDQEGLRDTALAAAVSSAHRQAEVLAQAAGVELGELQSIEHSWSEVRLHHSEVSYTMAEAQGAPLADVDPEDIGTTDTATLVWEIR